MLRERVLQRSLLIALIVIFPIQVASVLLGGKVVYFSTLLMMAILSLSLFTGGAVKTFNMHARPISAFALFLVLGAVGIAISPYYPLLMAKGIVQMVGMTAGLVLAICIVNECTHDWKFSLRLIRFLIVTLGAVGWLGVAQFAWFNLDGKGGLLDLVWLQEWLGGRIVGDPGYIIAPWLYRVSSTALEPNDLSRFLNMGSGLALLRLGLAGGNCVTALSSVVPKWAAWGVLLGIFVAHSLVGLLVLGFMVVVTYLFATRRKWVRPGWIAVFVTLGLAASILGPQVVTNKTLFDKLKGSIFLFTPVSDDIAVQGMTREQAITHEQAIVLAGAGASLALLANAEVVKHVLNQSPLFGVGLGGHPLAYAEHQPEWATKYWGSAGINAQDAGALLLRLLSESGLIGAAIFLVGLAWITCSATVMLWRLGAIPNNLKDDLLWLALGAGVIPGWLGAIASYLLRAPYYYEAGFWLLAGLCLAWAAIARQMHERSQSS